MGLVVREGKYLHHEQNTNKRLVHCLGVKEIGESGGRLRSVCSPFMKQVIV